MTDAPLSVVKMNTQIPATGILQPDFTNVDTRCESSTRPPNLCAYRLFFANSLARCDATTPRVAAGWIYSTPRGAHFPSPEVTSPPRSAQFPPWCADPNSCPNNDGTGPKPRLPGSGERAASPTLGLRMPARRPARGPAHASRTRRSPTRRRRCSSRTRSRRARCGPRVS